MHYATMVTFTALPDETREAAYVRLQTWLDANVHEGEWEEDAEGNEVETTSAGPIDGDWFVIGGRWSGKLSPAMMNERWDAESTRLLAETAKELGNTNDPLFGYPETVYEKARKPLNALWAATGGEYTNWYDRDPYRAEQFFDDVRPLDQRAYDDYLLPFVATAKRDSVANGDRWNDPVAWIDVEGDPLSEQMIGGKWLAIVDIHT